MTKKNKDRIEELKEELRLAEPDLLSWKRTYEKLKELLIRNERKRIFDRINEEMRKYPDEEGWIAIQNIQEEEE